MTTPALTDAAAMDAIQRTMSGREWDSDTLAEVAEIMRAAGYPIDDVGEEG